MSLMDSPAFHRSHNRRARSRSLQSLLSEPPQVLRVLAWSTTSRALRNNVLGKLEQLNARTETRPPMDPEVRKRLQREFKVVR